MLHKNNKKGFTLIEMMAVIAIIAILVGIMVPQVVSYRTKANAATNAANLRAIKASISPLMVQGKITYTSTEETQQQVDEIVAQQKQIEKNYAEKGWADFYIYDFTWNQLELSRVAARGVIVATDRLENTYYAKNEKMDVDGIVLTAPSSKAIDVAGLKLRAGTEMKATVCENEIVVTYGGIPLEVFALIAEYGDLTEVNMGETPHDYVDSNDDDVCDLCNGTYPHGRGDQAGAELDKELGNVHTCTDKTGDGDHLCDDRTCPLTCSDCDIKGENYSCSECGKAHVCDHGSRGNTRCSCGCRRSRGCKYPG